MTTTGVATAPGRPRLHRSTRWLVAVVAVGLTLTVTVRILGRLDLLVASRVPTDLLHVALIVGVVLLLGNVVVTEAWVVMAERTRDPEVLRFAAQTVTWGDVAFTAPGIYLVVISGLLLLEQGNGPDGGALGAEIALGVAGAAWMIGLVPLQNELALRAAGSRLDEGFTRLLHRWYVCGLATTALTVVALLLVVL